MDVKENVRNVDTWMRGLFIVIFGVIFYFLVIIIWLLVIFQFLTKVMTGNLNQYLDNFSVGLTEYTLQILNYVTFRSNDRPFPFSPLPGSNITAPTDTAPGSDDKPGQEDAGEDTDKSAS
ncbi:MAG TPA: DUF4389 domain-containing protein [Gammaproteobacteria bacterium]|nr:DUF4389 domain-containing protein [Gammaproteobacteria bacterium]